MPRRLVLDLSLGSERIVSGIGLERLGRVDLYTTMDNERNLILHPGEPDKVTESLQIGTNDSANRVLRIYFPWETGKSADEICDEFIRDVRSIIDDAKTAFAELNS